MPAFFRLLSSFALHFSAFGAVVLTSHEVNTTCKETNTPIINVGQT